MALRPLRDLPIRQKLVWITMLASGVALALATLALVAVEVTRSRREIRRDLAALAAIVADNSTAALTFDDRAAAEETLAALRARPSIRAAALYDGEGRLFARYSRSREPGGLPARPGPDGHHFTDDDLELYQPVSLKGQRIGTVYLRSDLREMAGRLRTQAATVAAVLLLAALLALLLSSRLQRVISTPILALAETARAVSARKDYSLRAERQGADELGELVEAFNQMLAQIEERDSRLRAARDELERRVEERTLELKQELAERRRAEEELARRNAELAQSNKELDDFAYVASHDLKEPLRGIHNYSSFLLEDYGDRLDQEGRFKLETLTRLTRRMEALIDSLLHFSRVGRLELELEAVDLNETVAGVVDSLAVTLAESGAEVRVPRPLPTVRCDRVRVGEVFGNLISNAVKYNDQPGKWVEVGALDGQPGGAPPVLYVRDNGIGIPDKHQDAIFRIFKRLHGRDQFGGGTGAGLTIVKKIVERHGGRIWLESAPGRGSTFYFTLGKELE